jgi:hypothetical protein
MIDKQKRNTLKLIGGSGVVAATATSASLLGTSLAGAADTQAVSPLRADLEVMIIDTGSLPEDTALITNLTNGDVVIDDFLPGTIFFNDKWVSLNDVFSRSLLNGRVVPAGHSVSAPIKFQPLGHGETGDYLWAQQSVSALTEQTDIVTLAATLQQRRAVVFAPAASARFA